MILTCLCEQSGSKAVSSQLFIHIGSFIVRLNLSALSYIIPFDMSSLTDRTQVHGGTRTAYVVVDSQQINDRKYALFMAGTEARFRITLSNFVTGKPVSVHYAVYQPNGGNGVLDLENPFVNNILHDESPDYGKPGKNNDIRLIKEYWPRHVQTPPGVSRAGLDGVWGTAYEEGGFLVGYYNSVRIPAGSRTVIVSVPLKEDGSKRVATEIWFTILSIQQIHNSTYCKGGEYWQNSYFDYDGNRHYGYLVRQLTPVAWVDGFEEQGLNDYYRVGYPSTVSAWIQH